MSFDFTAALLSFTSICLAKLATSVVTPKINGFTSERESLFPDLPTRFSNVGIRCPKLSQRGTFEPDSRAVNY